MTDKELTQEQSRSVQRRIAAQKGLPAPDFSLRDQHQAVVKKLYELVSDEVAQVIETFGLQDKVRMPRKWEELPETAKEYWQEKAKLLVRERRLKRKRMKNIVLNSSLG